MYRLSLTMLCLFLVIFSCKKQSDTTDTVQEKTSHELTEKEVSKIDYDDFLLDEKTIEYTEYWDQYNELQTVLDNFKKADISFLIENNEVVTTTLKDLKQNIPEPLNTSSIIARINAFETKFLKLESLANLSSTSKEELIASIKDVLVAFSNFNLQMNKKVEFDHLNIEKP
ncbi:hypothetical protein [Seonamhaeicola marinus]|uniref:Uncharacterized protein n=1 Tax=Seonamhaeicola marinus TaxID=1912246 RepID=A0A5D0HT09_9FLAO|nr:hypothetical protein [Seonamhaeicola marinus]TYA74456.1 hypothetical protein FUA24_14120 [Seonamhaeicola marinus]